MLLISFPKGLFINTILLRKFRILRKIFQTIFEGLAKANSRKFLINLTKIINLQ
jgi:hypothetical protein